MGTIREALEGAIGDQFEEETPQQESEPPEPTSSEGASTESDAVEAKPSTTSEPAEAVKPEQQGRERDETGKFVPKPKDAPQKAAVAPKAPVPAKPGEAAQKPPQAAPATPPASKAPQSWKATERELWGKLPPEAQAVVARREAEITRALQEAAPARQTAQKWNEVTSPFEAMVRSQGGDMHGTVDNLLRTQYALHTAPAHGKAQIVANIISQFGVDPGAVASFLTGQQPPQQQQGFDPNQFAQQLEQRIVGRFEQQQSSARVQHEIQQLAQFEAEHEFVDDLREHMAKLLEAGLADNWEDAYSKAASLSPDVSRALQQREEAKQANAARASTQRARAASSGLKSTPAGPTGGSRPSSLREHLEAAWDNKTGQSR